MKISNKTKDYLVLILICVVVIWVLSSALYWVKSLFAEEIKLSDIELQNKYYAEERIKSEMNFLAMKHYMDNISVEEYIETFYSKEVNK